MQNSSLIGVETIVIDNHDYIALIDEEFCTYGNYPPSTESAGGSPAWDRETSPRFGEECPFVPAPRSAGEGRRSVASAEGTHAYGDGQEGLAGDQAEEAGHEGGEGRRARRGQGGDERPDEGPEGHEGERQVPGLHAAQASRAQRGALIQQANEHVGPVTEARKGLGKLARGKGFFKTIAQHPQLLAAASAALDPKLARHATARATR